MLQGHNERTAFPQYEPSLSLSGDTYSDTTSLLLQSKHTHTHTQEGERERERERERGREREREGGRSIKTAQGRYPFPTFELVFVSKRYDLFFLTYCSSVPCIMNGIMSRGFSPSSAIPTSGMTFGWLKESIASPSLTSCFLLSSADNADRKQGNLANVCSNYEHTFEVLMAYSSSLIYPE